MISILFKKLNIVGNNCEHLLSCCVDPFSKYAAQALEDMCQWLDHCEKVAVCFPADECDQMRTIFVQFIMTYL